MRATSMFIWPMLMCCTLFICSGSAVSAEPGKEFAKEYQAWKADCEKVEASADLMARLDSPHFKKIVDMGPEVLPSVADVCLNDTSFQWAAWAWIYITKMNPDPSVNPWARDSVKTWVEGGPELAKKRFESQYSKLREARKNGKAREVTKHKAAIRAMGILALAPMFDALEQGEDADIIFLVDEVTGDALDAMKADRATRKNWWADNKDKYRLRPMSDRNMTPEE